MSKNLSFNEMPDLFAFFLFARISITGIFLQIYNRSFFIFTFRIVKLIKALYFIRMMYRKKGGNGPGSLLPQAKCRNAGVKQKNFSLEKHGIFYAVGVKRFYTVGKSLPTTLF